MNALNFLYEKPTVGWLEFLLSPNDVEGALNKYKGNPVPAMTKGERQVFL